MTSFLVSGDLYVYLSVLHYSMANKYPHFLDHLQIYENFYYVCD